MLIIYDFRSHYFFHKTCHNEAILFLGDGTMTNYDDLLDLLRTRRSVRAFTPEPVSDEDIKKILEAARWAMSGGNAQPWEFLVVKDNDGIEKIENMSQYSKPAKTSTCCIIPLFNKDYIDKFEDYIWVQQDMGACTQNILLQAVDEGLGAVWLGTYPDEERVNYLKEHFNIPENVFPYSVIVLGYPTGDYTGTDRFDKDRIHYETY